MQALNEMFMSDEETDSIFFKCSPTWRSDNLIQGRAPSNQHVRMVRRVEVANGGTKVGIVSPGHQ